MREIVLDTETTGLDPRSGHRIVEIGCVELVNLMPTGRTFHRYIDPERDMPAEAFAVHGLSREFLSQHKVFAAEVDAFIDFVGDARLVIHNASFDMKFINAELERLARPQLPMSQALDTVQMARERFRGAQVSLDALCRRFNIESSHRVKHGALLDAELLAEVYLELTGGRQPGLLLGAKAGDTETTTTAPRREWPRRQFAPAEAEIAAHDAFVEKLSDPIWRR
ncbi:DNA polymerase III subunit epsilon [Oceanibacterium hippocampi]|uniref:DNA polymerase III subunit epsilon n=1 Tax=Oceanibacterium hippocampi TaxID=745714 RepID=A0A1Y5RRH3_9PROT|nr:DNA polymerase III subunit epsilon [Oceanibacterium hippocampi]SLN20972.1 DNA polymerase III subunit epsilon [Oceanibacterium hippocampi]